MLGIASGVLLVLCSVLFTVYILPYGLASIFMGEDNRRGWLEEVCLLFLAGFVVLIPLSMLGFGVYMVVVYTIRTYI